MFNGGATKLVAIEPSISKKNAQTECRDAHLSAVVMQQYISRDFVDNTCLNARSALVQNTQLGLRCFLAPDTQAPESRGWM